MDGMDGMGESANGFDEWSLGEENAGTDATRRSAMHCSAVVAVVVVANEIMHAGSRVLARHRLDRLDMGWLHYGIRWWF